MEVMETMKIFWTFFQFEFDKDSSVCDYFLNSDASLIVNITTIITATPAVLVTTEAIFPKYDDRWLMIKYQNILEIKVVAVKQVKSL